MLKQHEAQIRLEDSLYIQGRLQAGIATVTYTDNNKETHMLIVRDNPLWPDKDNAHTAQFAGGKIDVSDSFHSRIKALPKDMLNQTMRKPLEYLKHHASSKAHQKLLDLETILEGTLRETNEETNLDIAKLLENRPDSFIEYSNQIRKNHFKHGATDLHYFHIHLGQLSPKDEQALQENCTPQDDVLMAGFVPKKNFIFNHLENKQSFIEEYTQFAKLNQPDYSNRAARKGLDSNTRKELDDIERKCDDGYAPKLLEPFNIDATLTPLTRNAQEKDIAAIAYQAFERVHHHNLKTEKKPLNLIQADDANATDGLAEHRTRQTAKHVTR